MLYSLVKSCPRCGYYEMWYEKRDGAIRYALWCNCCTVFAYGYTLAEAYHDVVRRIPDMEDDPRLPMFRAKARNERELRKRERDFLESGEEVMPRIAPSSQAVPVTTVVPKVATIIASPLDLDDDEATDEDPWMR